MARIIAHSLFQTWIVTKDDLRNSGDLTISLPIFTLMIHVHNAEEILHSILTSTDILTWNSQGEIVYRGHDIRGTDIADLLRYCVTHYNPDVPEPYGMNIFLKGLTSLEIDKGLIGNKKVLQS